MSSRFDYFTFAFGLFGFEITKTGNYKLRGTWNAPDPSRLQSEIWWIWLALRNSAARSMR